MDKLGLMSLLSTKSEKTIAKNSNSKSESLKGVLSSTGKNGMLFKNIIVDKNIDKNVEKSNVKESKSEKQVSVETAVKSKELYSKISSNQLKEKNSTKQDISQEIAEKERVEVVEKPMQTILKSESVKTAVEPKSAASLYEKSASKEVEKKEKKSQETSFGSSTVLTHYVPADVTKINELKTDVKPAEASLAKEAGMEIKDKKIGVAANSGLKQYGLTKIEEKSSFTVEVPQKVLDSSENKSEGLKSSSEIKAKELINDVKADKKESLNIGSTLEKQTLEVEKRVSTSENSRKEQNESKVQNSSADIVKQENKINEKNESYASKETVEELLKKGVAEITVSKGDNKIETKMQPRMDIKQVDLSAVKEKSDEQTVVKERLVSGESNISESNIEDKKVVSEGKADERELKKDENVAGLKENGLKENFKERTNFVKNDNEIKNGLNHLNLEADKTAKMVSEFEKTDLKETAVKEESEIKKNSHLKESVAEIKPKQDESKKTETVVQKNSDVSDKNFVLNNNYSFENSQNQTIDGNMKTQENQVVSKNINYESMYSQVDSFIKMNFNSETREMKMRLTPDDLGEVEVKINIDKNIMIAEFTVESQRVKEVLESRFNELKNNLNEKGIDVSQINVSISNGDNGNRQEQRFAWDEMQEMRKVNSSNRVENRDYSKINEAAVSYYNNKSSTGINILY